MYKLLPLLIVLVLILAACGDATSTAASSPQKQPATPTATPEPHHHVGETVERDGFAITLKSVKMVDPASIPQHEQILPDVKSDQTFVVLDEYAKNTTTKDQALAGAHLVFQDTQGNHYTLYELNANTNPSGLGGTIAAGMQQHSVEAFAVPKSVHDFNWMYEPNAGTMVVWDIHV